jgi:hypothetical protein
MSVIIKINVPKGNLIDYQNVWWGQFKNTLGNNDRIKYFISSQII